MQIVYKVHSDLGCDAQLAIENAARALRAGCVALLPTETVYGLGVSVSAAQEQRELACVQTRLSATQKTSGYERIFSLKHRPLSQTMPWLVKDLCACERYACELDRRIRHLIHVFWPGALTVVVPASDEVPEFLRAADGTVALRASAHPVVQALIDACASPLATTSANTHGAPAPNSFAEVEPHVAAGVDIAFDAGVTACEAASTIVSCTGETLEILREGAISRTRIIEALDSFAES